MKKLTFSSGKYSTNSRGYQRACGGNAKRTNPVDETLQRSLLVSDFTRSQREGNSVKKEDNALDKRTQTKNESLASSLLIHIKDTKPQEKDLVEAFCRDVDSFNLAFQVFRTIFCNYCILDTFFRIVRCHRCGGLANIVPKFQIVHVLLFMIAMIVTVVGVWILQTGLNWAWAGQTGWQIQNYGSFCQKHSDWFGSGMISTLLVSKLGAHLLDFQTTVLMARK